MTMIMMMLDYSSLASGDVSGLPAQCGVTNRDLSMGGSTQFILDQYIPFVHSLNFRQVLGDLGPRADAAGQEEGI